LAEIRSHRLKLSVGFDDSLVGYDPFFPHHVFDCTNCWLVVFAHVFHPFRLEAFAQSDFRLELDILRQNLDQGCRRLKVQIGVATSGQLTSARNPQDSAVPALLLADRQNVSPCACASSASYFHLKLFSS
jgi:hypothetical protein